MLSISRITFTVQTRSKSSHLGQISLQIASAFIQSSGPSGSQEGDSPESLVETIRRSLPVKDVLYGADLKTILQKITDKYGHDSSRVVNETSARVRINCAGHGFFLCIAAPDIQEITEKFYVGILIPVLDVYSEDLVEAFLKVMLFQHFHNRALSQEKQKRFAIEKQSAVAAAIFKINSQIAHDIRSPLAALAVVNDEATDLPENQRILVREAVARIQDIANNLISDHKVQETLSRGGSAVTEEGEAKLETILLAPLIESVISEKRLEFRSRLGVSIQAELGAASYALFAQIQPVEIKNVLSNLINNSVEALKTKGIVTVSLFKKDNMTRIQVTDNGSGIPSDNLPKLMQHGASFGKPNKGNGWGLFLAKTTLERLHGTISIESEVGKGTQITLGLPTCPHPVWFVPEIRLKTGTTIVILDDDASIHHIWDTRFRSLKLEQNGNEVVHLSSGDEFVNWCAEHRDSKQSTLFLMDQELLGQDRTGLQLIEQLGNMKQSILVTSRYEETTILEEVKRLGIKLIPKGSARFVPIAMEGATGSQVDCVLIDNDTLTGLSWISSAERHNKQLKVYSNPDQFLADAGGFAITTPIYVDVDLGNGLDGRNVSRQLYDSGFRNIYLATGYSAENLGEMEWIRGIVTKAPPFGKKR